MVRGLALALLPAAQALESDGILLLEEWFQQDYYWMIQNQRLKDSSSLGNRFLLCSSLFFFFFFSPRSRVITCPSRSAASGFSLGIRKGPLHHRFTVAFDDIQSFKNTCSSALLICQVCSCIEYLCPHSAPRPIANLGTSVSSPQPSLSPSPQPGLHPLEPLRADRHQQRQRPLCTLVTSSGASRQYSILCWTNTAGASNLLRLSFESMLALYGIESLVSVSGQFVAPCGSCL